MNGEWKSINNLPKCDGRYLVRFYFPYRHETDRTESAYRDFINRKWIMPYYSYQNERSHLYAWFDEQ